MIRPLAARRIVTAPFSMVVTIDRLPSSTLTGMICVREEKLERLFDMCVVAPESMYQREESFTFQEILPLAIREKASVDSSCFDSLYLTRKSLFTSALLVVHFEMMMQLPAMIFCVPALPTLSAFSDIARATS